MTQSIRQDLQDNLDIDRFPEENGQTQSPAAIWLPYSI
jgi:hypothetical protein